MTNQSVNAQSITESMMRVISGVSIKSGKPLYQVVAEYQKQCELVAFNKKKREWMKEDEQEEETEYRQEDERCSFQRA